MSSSQVDANKAVVRRYVDEVQVSGREDVAAELLAADFLNHGGPEWARELPGPDSAVMFARRLRAALSDLEAVIHEQVGEGDLVVTRKTFRGTHIGELMGIPPSGAKVVIDAIDILRVVDGQLTEHWVIADTANLMAGGRPQAPPSIGRG
jgi:predicted SnoaL-like aldol condensation-catalyzing enzyme